MSLVMGMDQHRAQISAEWLDTMTAEVFRARIAPADRAGVRKFLGRFAGEDLEVALEATTGWRFVVEELERVGAEVHLAEPTETSGLKSKKKRAKTDWADARHLRELLLLGRLPESWIPPAHILDLRGRVRLRHTLSHQRTEWQQRIQAVLYHHGIPQRRDLLTLEKRQWLARQKLPAAAREQITIALEMIDALDIQLAPFDAALRAYARKLSIYQVVSARAEGGHDYPGSYGELLAWFPDDHACIDYLEWLRWPDGFHCPRCVSRAGWRLSSGRWECAVARARRR